MCIALGMIGLKERYEGSGVAISQERETTVSDTYCTVCMLHTCRHPLAHFPPDRSVCQASHTAISDTGKDTELFGPRSILNLNINFKVNLNWHISA